jgi:hypothetical protein
MLKSKTHFTQNHLQSLFFRTFQGLKIDAVHVVRVSAVILRPASTGRNVKVSSNLVNVNVSIYTTTHFQKTKDENNNVLCCLKSPSPGTFIPCVA